MTNANLNANGNTFDNIGSHRFTPAAWSGTIADGDVAVFVGRRKVLGAGHLHQDGSVTINGYHYGSPSRALWDVTGRRASGWKHMFYVDQNGTVRPIQALRESDGAQQVEIPTDAVRTVSHNEARYLRSLSEITHHPMGRTAWDRVNRDLRDLRAEARSTK